MKAAASTPRSRRATRPPLLLVVEDDTQIVELLGMLAAAIGVEMHAARSAAEAIEAVSRLRPSLITLDIVLPDMDGLRVLEHLRNRNDLDDVPIIAISGLSDPATVKRAYALGVSEFIAKPFAVDLLDAKLRASLRMRQLADEIRAREQFLVEVVEHISSGLAVCDREGALLRLNSAGAMHLGLADADAAIGRRLPDLALGAEALLAIEAGTTQRKASVYGPAGPRELGFTTRALESGDIVVVFRDLGQPGTREAEAQKRVETMSRSARAFAHEVRNPLSAVSAAAQVLGRADVPQALREKLARAVEDEAQRVASLVREFVEGQAPGPPSSRADVETVLREIHDVNLMALPGRARVRIEAERPLPPVRAEPSRIKQVALNLVLNALAATEQGGDVVCSIGADGDHVRLIVRDTGCGIAATDLPHIFDETFSTRMTGEGLGLPITRRVVEELGGRIEVASTVGRGSTFTVWWKAVAR